MPGDDRFAQAHELLDAGTPKAWVWDEDGPRVVGEVVGGFRGSTKFHSNVPVLTLKLPDGTLRSVWGTGVLADKLQKLVEQGLSVGDVIGVERGKAKELSAGGNEYWPFQVVRLPGADNANVLAGGPQMALPRSDAQPPEARVVDEFEAVPVEAYEEPHGEYSW